MRRVELGGVVDEPAMADLARARPTSLRIDEPIQLPAAIGRELPDRVLAGRHQAPEILRGTHPAGIAAADPDDRDRLVHEWLTDCGPRTDLRPTGRLGQHRLCQLCRSRVIEDQAGAKPKPGRRYEPVPQLDRGGRVEAELLERPSRIDLVGGAVPEHDRHLRQDLVEHRVVAILLRQGGDPSGERASRRFRGPLVLVDGRRLDPRLGRRHGRLARAGERGVDPVTLALEGVSGEANPARLRIGERRLPVHLRAPHVRLRQRGQEASGAALASLKGRDYGRPLELSQDGLGDLRDAEGENRVGTDLDEGPPPLPQELLDRRLEEHRPAQVVEPVLGVHQGCVGGLAGDGGVEGELAGAWLDPGQG